MAHDSEGCKVQVAWFDKGLQLHHFMTEKQTRKQSCRLRDRIVNKETRDKGKGQLYSFITIFSHREKHGPGIAKFISSKGCALKSDNLQKAILPP